jgi:predicted Zn-dependent protease
MLEFAFQPGEGGEAPAVVTRAAEIATQAFFECGFTDVYHRMFDAGEAESLAGATTPSGIVDLRAFVAKQWEKRGELMVPTDQKTLSAVYGESAVHDTTSNRALFVNGFSVHEYGEGVLSTHNLRMLLLENPTYNRYAAHFFAYTLAHEGGHLFKLVDPSADRFTDGRHCGNFCVMKSTSIHETAEYLEQTGGPVHFCDDCAEDIGRADQ